MAVVRINYRGEPLSPSFQETFFDTFNSQRKRKGGMGQGATYAYLVIKAHGGEISVESNDNDGTTVTVQLDTC